MIAKTDELNTLCRSNITLQDSLNALKGPLAKAVALVYGQEHCAFADAENGRLVFHKNEAPAYIYEVRVFNSRCELRWMADAERYDCTRDALGSAVVLFEDSQITVPGWTMSEAADHIVPDRFAAGQYILWHPIKRGRAEAGWVELYEHRVGSLFAPISEDFPTERLVLNFVEYVGYDNHGNAAIVAERLTGLGTI